MRDRFLSALLESMHFSPDLLSGRPGVAVAGTESRAENHVTAAYQMGEHLVVTCDPAAEQMLRGATAGMDPTLEAWERIASAAGGEFLGRVRMQLLPAGADPRVEVAEGYNHRSLDPRDTDDLALIRRMVDVSDADDLDEAEIEIDDLDDIIDVILDTDGEIASYSAARPFDLAKEFGDIGIMTRPEHRGRSLGSAAVAALCGRLWESGLEPLYRCEEENAGSVALSAGMGFKIATQLTAYRFA